MSMWNYFACLIVLAVFSFSAQGAIPPKKVTDPLVKLRPLPEHSMTFRYVISYLIRSHYYRPRVDDKLSEKIFDEYIKTLDSTKSYFTKKDIDKFSVYKFKLDEAINQNDLSFAFDFFNLYQQRVKDRIVYALKLLNQVSKEGFNFNKHDRISLGREDSEWETDSKALDALWYKRLKSYTLNLKIGHEERDLAKAVEKTANSIKLQSKKIATKKQYQKLDTELRILITKSVRQVVKEDLRIEFPKLQKITDIDSLKHFKKREEELTNTWIKSSAINLYFEKLRSQSKQRQIEESLKFTGELFSLWINEIPELFKHYDKNTKKRLKDINELLTKRHQNQLNRLHQVNSEDAFQTYINAITQSYDPHTQYFSPRTSENFNINMSLSLQGIGAVLQMEDEYTKVQRLIPAGPADKLGQLSPEDRIISVGQGRKGELVDVIGWRLDEVVDLIRGPKGSIVRLEIIPKSSESSKLISIIRDEIKLEEQSAKSDIITIKRDNKIHKFGIIDIPAFYADFKALQENRQDYNSTSRDVKKLISKLKRDNIEGLIIDLRNNGGGSLQEVQDLTGFFISKGPIVQVRNPFGHVEVLSDEDPDLFYSGPMVVIINRLSASASEIFAGAMQDYGRALVVGSQTFGKGTVQGLQPLNKGQLKITQAKFYRISGGSTQHEGVVPDLLFPELYDKHKIGESALEQALPWDTIRAARYKKVQNIESIIPKLKSLHDQRIKTNPDFIFIEKQLSLANSLDQRTELTLNEHERRLERLNNDKMRLRLENERRIAKKLPLLINIDSQEEEITQTQVDEVSPIKSDLLEEPDAMLIETAEILMDFNQQINRTTAKP